MCDLLRVGSSEAVSTGLSREHPDVGGFDALAHRDRARVGLVGDAGEAAGHHLQPSGVAAA